MATTPVPIEPEELAETWRVYVSARCSCHREFLILHYHPLVPKLAARMRRERNFPRQVELEDLISYGTFGLIKAVERYRPENDRGTVFETVAVAHIRGAILDAIRAQDWAPRSVRRKQRELDAVIEEFECQYGRLPSVAETAKWMNLTPEEVENRVRDSQKSWPRSLDEQMHEEDSRYAYIEDPDPDPEAALESTLLLRVFVEAYRELSPREQLVIALYYFDGKKLSVIAQTLGVKDSVVSKIHVDVVAKLHTRFMATVQELSLWPEPATLTA